MSFNAPASTATAPAGRVRPDEGAYGTEVERSQRRHSTETKAAFKTTEFVAYLVAVVGVLIASLVVKTTDGHGDYFRADKAWFSLAFLPLASLVSGGLAKSGSREHYDA